MRRLVFFFKFVKGLSSWQMKPNLHPRQGWHLKLKFESRRISVIPIWHLSSIRDWHKTNGKMNIWCKNIWVPMPNKCLFKAPGPRSDSDIYSLFWVITTTVDTFLELDHSQVDFQGFEILLKLLWISFYITNLVCNSCMLKKRSPWLYPL